MKNVMQEDCPCCPYADLYGGYCSYYHFFPANKQYFQKKELQHILWTLGLNANLKIKKNEEDYVQRQVQTD